jgi:hypothetical protein
MPQGFDFLMHTEGELGDYRPSPCRGDVGISSGAADEHDTALLVLFRLR